jgi:DNA (cytosine-5)-methyltransferase 1
MLEVVDLFCGAGGMSCGLQQSGLKLRLGIDYDSDSICTYSRNFPSSKAINADVADLSASQILTHLKNPECFVLAGCPPCQMFSQLHRSSRTVGDEFHQYLRLLWTLRPAYLVFENVPRIVSFKSAWDLLLDRLQRRGYHVNYVKIDAAEFGVPQKRKRLVLVASRSEFGFLPIEKARRRTVRDAIGHLPNVDETIPNHLTMKLSDTNLARLKATPKNGGRSKPKLSAFDDSYGRMRWDSPSPTITTRCISFSNGAFGHPSYNRAITVREAALLQGFPDDFEFTGGVWSSARQVGNAVPPPVATWLGNSIRHHYQNNKTKLRLTA